MVRDNNWFKIPFRSAITDLENLLGMPSGADLRPVTMGPTPILKQPNLVAKAPPASLRGSSDLRPLLTAARSANDEALAVFKKLAPLASLASNIEREWLRLHPPKRVVPPDSVGIGGGGGGGAPSPRPQPPAPTPTPPGSKPAPTPPKQPVKPANPFPYVSLVPGEAAHIDGAGFFGGGTTLLRNSSNWRINVTIMVWDASLWSNFRTVFNLPVEGNTTILAWQPVVPYTPPSGGPHQRYDSVIQDASWG